MNSCPLPRCVVLLSWLVACAGAKADGEPGFLALEGDRAATPADPTDNGSDSNGASDREPSFVSDPLLTDVQPGSASQGCTKVDFLFVVDNSLSMLEEQTALVNSFPGFMNVVEETLGATDFHVMVVDTDAGGVRDAIASLLGQGGDTCGPTLGAGRRQSQAGEDCGLANDLGYIDASQTDLSAAFSCVAEVGTLGNPSEAPVDAMLASLAPTLNAPGGCNAGFLRNDAMLVITLIGDEDDGVSRGEPADWRDALVQAKGGSAESIVFLGLVGGETSAGSATCVGSAPDPAPRLHRLIESFSYGTVGDICAGDYAPFFAQSVGVIDTACDDFVPVIR